MFRKDITKNVIAIITLLLAMSALVWHGGEKLSALDKDMAAFSAFRTDQAYINKDQISLNIKTAEKLTRVETMVEMVVKSMGMSPPPRRRADR